MIVTNNKKIKESFVMYTAKFDSFSLANIICHTGLRRYIKNNTPKNHKGESGKLGTLRNCFCQNSNGLLSNSENLYCLYKRSIAEKNNKGMSILFLVILQFSLIERFFPITK